MVLGLFDQLQIFSQLYLIELLGLLTCLGLHELWHLIYPGVLTGFGMLVFFTNLSLISSFLSNRQLRVVVNGKSSQEYQVNAGVLQGSIFGPTIFLLYINDLSEVVICNIAISDTTLYSKCGLASDLWQ